MDTININANGQSISFSTKSLTINNEEFLYTGIQAIKHSSAKRLYLFKYQGTWHNLYYNDEDQKKVAAIFKRVAAMNAKRAKATEPVAEETAPKDTVPEEAKAAETEPEEAKATEPATEEDAKAAEPATDEKSEGNAEEKAEENAEEKADSTEEKTDDSKSDEAGQSTESEEKIEKKKKLKKSIIVLIVIILLFVAAGIAYFFILGPSNDASSTKGTNSTHQYDDIEELIDEMQE